LVSKLTFNIVMGIQIGGLAYCAWAVANVPRIATANAGARNEDLMLRLLCSSFELDFIFNCILAEQPRPIGLALKAGRYGSPNRFWI
jgi:hypothetical protein